MGRNMGFDFGLSDPTTCFKRKYRWLLKIDGVSAEGANALPPLKSARPNLSFKEFQVEHLTDTLYYPSKPDWKPLTLVLFDIGSNGNPVIDWIKKIYDAAGEDWNPSGDNDFKKTATLEMYDGCGNVIETWTFENAWPQQIEFGELDMGSSEIVMVEVTLRFDRAYVN